ncbi:probable serine/threonine-protein kinase clkA [Nilaparvata lugens]|uniref:probable serine/threonine-protein kinase clkA n=1 Tax=Nilaparvata lugens TaxID=108931 RepID=UPI00193D261E|nr:probable serine/threonine-protein kinase clkA [Nilaparvata lugens]
MVEERPSSPKFFPPNDQYQPNIYIPQAPTDFSHPPEAGREYSQPTAPAVNQVPLQEEHHNERPDYETQPNDEDYLNPAERPRGRPYAGSLAEELDGATGEEDPEKSIPGSPEQDYPVFEEIPRTSFSCRDKPVPAYYADVEARCQVFHICDVGGHKHSFLCPNGSVFNQKYLVCDWWYDFACENAENLFSKQLLDATATTPNDRQTFPNDRQTFSDAAQTFSNDGQLIYSQNPTGDYNVNQGFLNPGLPQTQLDTPQQVYTGNYYVPQNDIFHGAETGFPGRDLIHANSENARKIDENNVNNTGNVNTNNEGLNNGNNNQNNNNNVANLNTGNVNNNVNLNNGELNYANLNNGELNNANFNNGNTNNGNLNHENVNIGNYNNNANSNNGNLNYGGNFNNGNANFNTRDLNVAGSNQGNFNNNGNLNNENFKAGSYNNENLNTTYNNQNVDKKGGEINYNTGDSNSKNPARSYIEGKNLDNFQNRQDEPPRNRKQYKVGRRRHDNNNSKQSTTQSSLNTGEKIPDKTQVYSEKVHSNPVGASVGEIHEQGLKNIVNDSVALQRNNNNENNYYNNEQRENGNSFQANVNSFNQPTPNTQYVPPSNTFREANNNNFQNNQYTI